MRFKEICFENFGPIKKGTIRQNKINVFFGPNNSGKSLASRLIHGINSTPPLSKLLHSSMMKRYLQSKKIDHNYLHLYAILHKSGISIFDIITYEKSNCSIRIRRPSRPLDFTINKKTLNGDHTVTSHMLYFALQEFANTYDSVYIPAGRTGTVQFFTSIARIRSQLLNDLLQAFGTGRSHMSDKPTAKELKKFTHSASNSMPDYLEQFYNLILLLQEDDLDTNIRRLFSDLFLGNVISKNPLGLPRLFYKDPTGFTTKLESAGSGTVAAFPIIAGLHYVEPNGTLIVEEPEAHLEPSRQLKLLEILQDVSYSKKTNLIFTTHSDYIVKKLLGLVSSGKIKHSDLNLYYFNRAPSTTTTTIEHIEVDRNGEAEQPIFDEAIDALIDEFSS